MEITGKRTWRLNGWRIWTIALVSIGLIATYLAQTQKVLEQQSSLLSMLASVAFGAAVLTGFLWKLVGEHSLTLIEVKDSVIAALKEEHANEIIEHKRTIEELSRKIQELTREVMEIKNFNFMLQKSKLELEESIQGYRTQIVDLETEGMQSRKKIDSLEQTLAIAERQLALTK